MARLRKQGGQTVSHYVCKHHFACGAGCFGTRHRGLVDHQDPVTKHGVQGEHARYCRRSGTVSSTSFMKADGAGS